MFAFLNVACGAKTKISYDSFPAPIKVGVFDLACANYSQDAAQMFVTKFSYSDRMFMHAISRAPEQEYSVTACSPNCIWQTLCVTF